MITPTSLTLSPSFCGVCGHRPDECTCVWSGGVGYPGSHIVTAEELDEAEEPSE